MRWHNVKSRSGVSHRSGIWEAWREGSVSFLIIKSDLFKALSLVCLRLGEVSGGSGSLETCTAVDDGELQ